MYLYLIFVALGVFFLLTASYPKNLNKNLMKTDDVKLKKIVRHDCEAQETFCMVDAECNSNCSAPSKCTFGRCKSRLAVSILPENNCNPEAGFVAFGVGNPQTGTLGYQCYSVDDGIAVSPEKYNRMCLNVDTQVNRVKINYLKKYPQKKDCFELDSIHVPATKTVRAYTQHSEKLVKMFRL